MDKFSFIRGKTTNENVLSSTVTEKSIAVMLSDGTEIQKKQVDDKRFQDLIVNKCSNRKVDAYQLTPNMVSFSGSDTKITGCASVKDTAEDGTTLSQDTINKARNLINEKIGEGVEIDCKRINWNGSGDNNPTKTNIRFTVNGVECNKDAVFKINGNVKKYEFTVAVNKDGTERVYTLHQTDDNGVLRKTNLNGYGLTEAIDKLPIGTVAETLRISKAPSEESKLGLAKEYTGLFCVSNSTGLSGSSVTSNQVHTSISYDELHRGSVYLVTRDNKIGDKINPLYCTKRENNKVYYGWYCPTNTYEADGTTPVAAKSTSSSHTYYAYAINRDNQEVRDGKRYDKSNTKYYTRNVTDEPIRINENANVTFNEDGSIKGKIDGDTSYAISGVVIKSVSTD